ncbi:MAG: hypothetical protein FJZ01_25635 [Candidatus Sericytochromatia bacterium]|nr:hypothetical protein [Candidatus Tanganyikabacteria bacterium]
MRSRAIPAPFAVGDENLGTVAADSAGNVYASGRYGTYKVSATGTVSQLSTLLFRALAVGPRDVLYGTIANKIVTIAGDGSTTPYAGSGEEGYQDGEAGTAKFGTANDLAFDPFGNLYVPEGGRIRKITPQGQVSTLAGGPLAGIADGTGSDARFRNASELAVDPVTGRLYVFDGHQIRRIE